MDLRKIGKLIAKLRNDKGLTQQALGDLVGVGFRAVSKWERGLNLPDIGNINELSEIFGVTSDEILKGELKQEEINESEETEEKINEESIENIGKKKLPLKIKIAISVITALVLIVTSLIIYAKHKVYVYKMISTDEDEYYVEGYVKLEKQQISIELDRLQFKNITTSTSGVNIKEYQYEIMCENNFIFGYGQTLEGINAGSKSTIENFLNNFIISYSGETKLKKEQIEHNSFSIKLTMWDNSYNELSKNIEFTLYKQ